jgi:hypothetical protein
MRYLFKATLIGVVVSFLVIPTVLLTAVRLLRLAPRTLVPTDLLNVYVLYGSVSALVFLILGVPIVSLYRRRGWVSWPMFALGGVFVAMIGEGLLMISGIGYWDVANVALLVQNTTMLAVGGFCAGTVFWAISRGTSLLVRK